MQNQGFESDGKNQYPSQPVGQPYPTQPYASAPDYGQPQPGYSYPNAPPYSAAYQANGAAPSSQQHVVIVAGQPAPVYVAQAQTFVSMAGAIVLSCFVFWLCGIILGGIAFILAMVGYSSASSGDFLGAMRLRNASYGVSIAGIVIGIIIIAVVAGIAGSAASRTSSYCYYSYGYTVCT